MTDQNKIDSLKAIQKSEEENNFKNDNLWNECEDAINSIRLSSKENTVTVNNYH